MVRIHKISKGISILSFLALASFYIILYAAKETTTMNVIMGISILSAILFGLIGVCLRYKNTLAWIALIMSVITFLLFFI